MPYSAEDWLTATPDQILEDMVKRHGKDDVEMAQLVMLVGIFKQLEQLNVNIHLQP